MRARSFSRNSAARGYSGPFSFSWSASLPVSPVSCGSFVSRYWTCNTRCFSVLDKVHSRTGGCSAMRYTYRFEFFQLYAEAPVRTHARARPCENLQCLLEGDFQVRHHVRQRDRAGARYARSTVNIDIIVALLLPVSYDAASGGARRRSETEGREGGARRRGEKEGRDGVARRSGAA